MKNSVYIRADGSARIGLGHLIRCSALAHMLKDDFDITFFCRSIPETLENEFRKSGFKIVKIEKEIEFLNAVDPDKIAVLDGYDFATDYQKTLKQKGAKLVCIDDLHDREFVADLIINHAPGITPQDYKAQPYTQFALGLDYTLLRPAFLKQAKKERRIDKIQTVLICFGGADPNGLTLKALKVISEFKEFKKIIVVTGAVFNEICEFDRLLKSETSIDQRNNLNENDMLDAMLEADLAIVPSSGILFEALTAGCRVISGIGADNQKYIYENCKKAGIIIDAGFFSETDLRKAISDALMRPLDYKKIIDEKTTQRILKLFYQLKIESIITLRDAKKEDLELTYNWASDSKVRQFSFNQHKISLSEHTDWFIGKIGDPYCFYLIAEYEGLPVGSIRFDINNRAAVISYLLDPEYHGRHFGQTILKKGIERLLTGNLYSISVINIIIGEVMKTNIPSIKSFERLGFFKNDLGNKYRFEKQL